LDTGAAIICGVVLFAAAGTVVATLAYMVCLPYLVIFIALKTPVLSFDKIGDLSYGTYLFAFPVQQSLIWLFGFEHIGPIGLSVVAVSITFLLAFASWRLVEKPCLQLRKRMSGSVVRMQVVGARAGKL
jgi:peptidoglycan/LPS O-acetylase OafA/YrhL